MKITFDKNNVNLGTSRGNEMLAHSLEKLGAGRSILVDKNGVTIAGNKTLAQAEKLGLNIKIVQSDPKTLIVVQRTDLDIENDNGTARELAIADNRISEINYEPDLCLLAEYSKEIDLTVYYNTEEVQQLLNSLVKPVENKTKENLLPSITVALGDVFTIGNHRIMCGSSLESTHIQKLLNNVRIDAVFSDPPYELAIQEVYTAFAFSESDHYIMICTFKQAAEMYAIKELEFRFDFVLNAHTPKSFMNSKQPYYVHQNGVYFTRFDAKTIFDCKNAQGIRSESSYWSTIIDAPRNTNSEHGHAKNLTGMRDALSGFSAKTIYDPFGGSGTTLLAAESLGKSCYIMELEPKHVQTILARVEKTLGVKAALEVA